MTVDAWFEFWIVHIVGDLAPNTRRNYRERYEYNVKPLIGGMQLADVKPMHCKMVFNQMEASYAGSTIPQTYIAGCCDERHDPEASDGRRSLYQARPRCG